MKKSDFAILTVIVLVLAPFFLFSGVYHAYREINAGFPYLITFVKFALLATFGEAVGLRIRTGRYTYPGFGLVPRALVWGFLGITIKMAFVIFGEGAPVMLQTMGVDFAGSDPVDVLRVSSFTWLKLLAAFSVGVTLNLFFAPVFMVFHRITDMHIQQTGGTLRGFFSPVKVGSLFQQMDWDSMWNFIFKKTIPFFWIPAQTINFLLPEEWRILVAALYSIILGVLLSVASLMAERRM